MLKNAAVLNPVSAAAPRGIIARVFNIVATTLPVLMLFFICTAAAYGGFFAKWGFCSTTENDPCMLQQMLDGSVRKPWIYRRLLPELGNWLGQHMPAVWHEYLLHVLQSGNLSLHYSPIIAAVGQPAETLLVFYYIYVLTWLAFFAATLLLWRIEIYITGDRMAAALAASLFALIMPLFLTIGGNFYDFTELFFFALATWLALSRAPFWLVLLAPLATSNKESFFFFLLTLYPILAARCGWQRAVAWLGAAVVASGISYALLKAHYAASPGGAVELHLRDQIEYFRHFGHLWQFEFQYGLLAPRGFNILSIVLVLLLVRAGFRRLSRPWRQHLQLALLINVPLFLLFCYPGELRNLSLLYMSLVAMLACALSHGLTRFYQQRLPIP